MANERPITLEQYNQLSTEIDGDNRSASSALILKPDIRELIDARSRMDNRIVAVNVTHPYNPA